MIHYCDCGSQTLLERCVVCERQDAANAMLDRISDLQLVEKLRAAIEVTEQFSAGTPEYNAVSAALLEDIRDYQEWVLMIRNLKYWRLTVADDAKPRHAEADKVMQDTLATTKTLLEEARRGRIAVLNGGKSRKRSARRKKRST